MKRTLLLLLICTLLLAGCTQEEPLPPTAAATTEAPTEPAGIYSPGSDAEKKSEGALRAYPVDALETTHMAVMGEDILLFSGEAVTTLTRLSGETLYETAKTELDCLIYPYDGSVQVTSLGVAYFNFETQETVMLSPTLQETGRIPMPADGVGAAVLSPDWSRLYYATETEIRELDLQTGLTRMLRSDPQLGLTVQRTHCDGQVLQCFAEADTGAGNDFYLSAQTGEVLAVVESAMFVVTEGEDWVAGHLSGTLQETLFSLDGGAVQTLSPDYLQYEPLPVLSLGGLVTCRQEENKAFLEYYDLSSGHLMDRVSLEGSGFLWDMAGQKSLGAVWFLWQDSAGQTTLYRWQVRRSGEDTSYRYGYYTQDAPDTEGLAQCRKLAEELSEKHNVEILVWQDALLEPFDYSFTPEYQVKTVQNALFRLDAVLERFPSGFLREASGGGRKAPLKICLVRSLIGDPEQGSLETAEGIQYFLEDDACIALTIGENMEQNFYHELGHVISIRVMSLCDAYDKWENLNPKGFAYDYDYLVNAQRDGSEYLAPGEEAFIDTYSMSFPAEDRSRIFEYAVTPGHESFFASDIMQKKLKALCDGIRQAFALEGDYYPWEQYLNK